jgi:Fe2+ transport system protein FeoA
LAEAQKIDDFLANRFRVLQMSLNCKADAGWVAEGQCARSIHCPLNQVKAGTAVKIKELAASPEVNHRLRELGFCEDKSIKLLSRQPNLICLVCNARLGLSPELAEKILVELVCVS